jgi:hypothetical protein
MRLLLVTGGLAGLSLACTQHSRLASASPQAAATSLHLTFSPVSDSFQAAAREYDSLWTADGARMVRALERTARLSFAEIGDTVIRATVLESPSSSGFHERPMVLRASYPLATKKATLMHELGHRLESHLFRASEDDHQFLFLWLYEAWTDIYGADFAHEQVGIEKRRGGVYPAAWDSALRLSAVERAARWDSVRASRLQSGTDELHSPAR